MHGTPARVLAQHLGRNLRFSGSRPPARGARPLPLGSVPGAAGEVGSTRGCVAMQFVRSVRRSIGRVIGGDPFGARVAASTSLQGGGMGGSRTGSYASRAGKEVLDLGDFQRDHEISRSPASCGGRRSKKRSALCKSDGLGRLREVSRQTIVRSALTSQR
jgi:hypothetical protein